MGVGVRRGWVSFCLGWWGRGWEWGWWLGLRVGVGFREDGMGGGWGLGTLILTHS